MTSEDLAAVAMIVAGIAFIVVVLLLWSGDCRREKQRKRNLPDRFDEMADYTQPDDAFRKAQQP